MHTPKIGLFGIGLDADWPQFAGLKERVESYTPRGDRWHKLQGMDLSAFTKLPR